MWAETKTTLRVKGQGQMSPKCNRAYSLHIFLPSCINFQSAVFQFLFLFGQTHWYTHGAEAIKKTCFAQNNKFVHKVQLQHEGNQQSAVADVYESGAS